MCHQLILRLALLNKGRQKNKVSIFKSSIKIKNQIMLKKEKHPAQSADPNQVLCILVCQVTDFILHNDYSPVTSLDTCFRCVRWTQVSTIKQTFILPSMWTNCCVGAKLFSAVSSLVGTPGSPGLMHQSMLYTISGTTRFVVFSFVLLIHFFEYCGQCSPLLDFLLVPQFTIIIPNNSQSSSK